MIFRRDIEAMEQWLKYGTVTREYLDYVLGDWSKSVSPYIPRVRALTQEDMAKMDCPFPQEPGYDD